MVLAVFVTVSAIHDETNMETCDARPKDTLAWAGAEVPAKTEKYSGELKDISIEAGFKKELIDLAEHAHCSLEGHRTPPNAILFQTLVKYMGEEQIAMILHDYYHCMNERIEANSVRFAEENIAQHDRDVSDVSRMESKVKAIQRVRAIQCQRRAAQKPRRGVVKKFAKYTPTYRNPQKTKIAKKTKHSKNTVKKSVMSKSRISKKPVIKETPETFEDISSHLQNFKI